MKRLLLIPLFVSLLATSCGDTPPINPVDDEGEWSEKIQNEMLLYLGEVLPFANFNLETLETEYIELTIDNYGENGNNYSLVDDNENNVLNNYGDKLTSKGFTFTKDEFEYDCYKKTTSLGLLVVYATWYPETTIFDEIVPAGNQIDAYLFTDR